MTRGKGGLYHLQGESVRGPLRESSRRMGAGGGCNCTRTHYIVCEASRITGYLGRVPREGPGEGCTRNRNQARADWGQRGHTRRQHKIGAKGEEARGGRPEMGRIADARALGADEGGVPSEGRRIVGSHIHEQRGRTSRVRDVCEKYGV